MNMNISIYWCWSSFLVQKAEEIDRRTAPPGGWIPKGGGPTVGRIPQWAEAGSPPSVGGTTAGMGNQT